MIRLPSQKLRTLVIAMGVSCSLTGCGGSTPPAQDQDDPSFDASEGDTGSAEPSSPKVAEGKEAIGAGDFAKAREVLEQAVAATPSDAQAHFYLAVASEGLKDSSKAIESYRRALDADRQLVDAYVNLSALLLDSEDASGSATVASEGLKVAPQHPDLLTNRALALEAMGKRDDALLAYGKAVEAARDNHELRFAYADLLARSGKAAESKGQLKLVVDGASDVRVLAAAGHLLAKLGSYADCVAAYDKALKSEKNSQLLVRRGLCRHELKDDAGALADYKEALKSDPKDAAAHYYLGRHLAESDRKDEACEHLNKAVELGEAGVVSSSKAAVKKFGCK